MSTQRDPVYEEFFTGGEAVDAPSALVREAVQNSLDAVLEDSEPVTVRITAGSTGLDSTVAAQYFQGLADHVAAARLPHITAAVFQQDCPFVAYEDFNTTGLTGDVDAFEAPESGGEKNNFYFFFRAEGRSGKSDTERGRWGVGKYVFPMSSQIRTFLVWSERAESEGVESALIGKSILRNHAIGESGYEPDGWWARIRAEDEAPLPFDSAEALDKFRSDWHLSRTPGDPGTSLVMPFTWDEINYETISESVAREYHLAILTSRLVVEVQRDGASVKLQASDIRARAPEMISTTADASRVSADLDLLQWFLDTGETHRPVSFRGGVAPRWSNATIDEPELTEVREQFEKEGRTAISIPITVERTNSGDAKQGHVTVLLEARPDHVGPPAFYREGILLSKEQEQVRIRGVRALVLVEDAAVGGMLGDAENPAHTKWSHTTAKFKGKYVHGASWLGVVRHAPSQLLKAMRGDVTEPDVDLASEFFSVRRPADETKGSSGESGPEGDTTPPTPPDPPRRAAVTVSGSGGTVVLKIASGLDRRVTSIEGDVAYDVRRGDPFRKYQTTDFDLSKMGVQVAGVAKHSRQRNSFRLDVSDPDQFEFVIEDFDTNRDVIVRTHVEYAE